MVMGVKSTGLHGLRSAGAAFYGPITCYMAVAQAALQKTSFRFKTTCFTHGSHKGAPAMSEDCAAAGFNVQAGHMVRRSARRAWQGLGCETTGCCSPTHESVKPWRFVVCRGQGAEFVKAHQAPWAQHAASRTYVTA